MTVAGVVEAKENEREPLLASSKLELSFEYLMPSGELQWVTIISTQAILLSLCLQSMVEELLRMRSGVPIKKAGEKSCTTQFSFKRKDGGEMIIPIRSGLHSISSPIKVMLIGELIGFLLTNGIRFRLVSIKMLAATSHCQVASILSKD